MSTYGQFCPVAKAMDYMLKRWDGFARFLADGGRPYVTLTLIGTNLLVFVLCGLGGGNFSSSMANISLFFPQRMKGNALALNAGLGLIFARGIAISRGSIVPTCRCRVVSTGRSALPSTRYPCSPGCLERAIV